MNIPLSIDRFAEKTEIEKTRLEHILPLLLEDKAIYGRYLDIEGVFIKRPLPIKHPETDQEVQYSCQIRKTDEYIPDEEEVWCPTCINSFHKNHLLEWIKIQGNCPVCQEKLSEELLIKQK
ncbi:MAG: hypothetical protein ACW967_04545 [Candidatus Hodarchaeales archaeon]|jgi:hypothetical protein